MKKILLTVACSCLIMVSLMFGIKSYAVTTTCDTYNGSNVGAQNYPWNYATTVKSYLVKSTSGGFMRVQGNAVSGKILVEYYDNNYNFLSSKTVKGELPIFGAFYETDSNYYILSGQTNYDEDDSVEVYRITKYDKSWKRISSCGLYGANTYIPFDAGSARMDFDGKYLLIRTCHEMYMSSDGLHHQANVTIQVDTDFMKITDSYTGVMNSSYGYVSHSFNQFIKTENGHIVAVDHGDAYPRSIVLIKYSTDYTTGKFVPGWGSYCTAVDLLTFPGATGQNYTGATIGGFEITDSSYLVAGNYVGDDNFSNASAVKNIFVVTVSKNLGDKPSLKWITNYTDGTVSTPHLVKLSSDKYLLMWSRNSKVYYMQIDGNGNKVGTVYNMDADLSDCVPLVNNGKVIWYTWDHETVTFYSISTSNISSNSKTVLENGHKFTIKNTSGGNVATQTCIVCGFTQKIKVATDFTMWWRKNSNSGYYSSAYSTTYHIGDTLDVWASLQETVDNSDFVFEISNESVATLSGNNYSNRRTVTMVKDGSFTLKIYPRYNKSAAKTYKFTVQHDYTNKVTKSATCTADGTKTYTCSTCDHTYKKTIKATGHSFKTTTAKATTSKAGKTVTKCTACGKTTKTVTIAKVSSIKLSATSCTYNGKVRTPSVTVKDSSGKTLKNGTDYKVTYASGRKNPGSYTIKVTLKGNYSGSKTFTFKILPTKVTSLKAKTQTTKTVTLSWKKVTGATGYQVYKYDSAKKEYVKVISTASTTYKVTDLKAGKTYKFKVRAYKKTGNTAVYSEYSSVLTTTTKPATPTLKATAGSKKATLSWKKSSGATGYEIYMATSKNGTYKKVATIKKAATVKYTKTGLTKGKTYYFKVRAYKTVSKTTVYSAYSSVKSVKVK